MSQQFRASAFRTSRRMFLALGASVFVGCTSPLIRGQSPELTDSTLEEEKKIDLVGDLCGAYGLNFKELQSIALVTTLDNTGSDPPPSPARTHLLNEMKGRDVRNVEEILASPKTSLVLVTAYLPPAVQKGDPLDIIIRVPAKSTTTSLRGGWLMQTRLREMATAGSRIYQGHEAGIGQGSIVIDEIFEGAEDKRKAVTGRVLGGGYSKQTRTLGLVIRRDDVSIETTTVIGAAVNDRFFTFEKGSKRGVAEPKNATYIELLVPPRYRQNLGRYVTVIRNIPLRQTAVQKAERLVSLERKLLEPSTSNQAALQLEALGRDSIPMLKKGLASNDQEIRFHSAEALAYLDQPESARTLTEAARDVSAFRWSALTALSSMDHVHAYEGLSELLHVDSAETRYGAFRALRMRNGSDPLVRGERLNGFQLHVMATSGTPMIHISRAERAEIVVFGHDIPFAAPQGIFAGKDIMLTSSDAEQIKLSKFAPGEEDRHIYCGTKVDQVIRAIASLGGTYGDVIQAIQEAKKTGAITARVDVDAMPKPGRAYFKNEEMADEPEEETGKNTPDLAEGMQQTKPAKAIGSDTLGSSASDSDELFIDPRFTPKSQKSTWSRLTNWWSGE